MSDESRSFHPLIDAMLSEFVPREGGPVLSDKDLRRWRTTLKSEGQDQQRLAEELVVLAMRFSGAGAHPSMMQVVTLAALLIGDLQTEALLESSGLAGHEARKLVQEARGSQDPLAKGLAPAGGGLKLRK